MLHIATYFCYVAVRHFIVWPCSNLFIHSPGWTLEYFPPLGPLWITLIETFLCMFSSEHRHSFLLGSRITRSLGRPIFSSGRHCSFPEHCNNLSTSSVWEFQLILILASRGNDHGFAFSHSIGCVTVPHGVFNLPFPDESSFWISSFLKCLFKCFADFLLGLFIFLLLISRMSWYMLELGSLSDMLSHFSRVWLFVTLWTITCQGSSVHGILQAKILEWVAMPSSRGSSWPRGQTQVSYVFCTDRRVLYH